MRIALYNLTTTTKHGGVESFVWDLARELAQREHAVTIIGGTGPVREPVPGVRIVTFPYISRRVWQSFPVLRRAYAEAKLLERLTMAVAALPELVRGGYDIIHIQKPYDIGPALLARRLGGARVILGCHGEDFYRGDRLLAGKVDGAVSCSRFNAQTVAARYGFEPQVVFNGIDTTLFRPLLAPPMPALVQEQHDRWGTHNFNHTHNGKTRHELRSTTILAPVMAGEPAKERPPRLLWVGRFQPWKGVDIAIRALAAIPRAQLLIAGDGEERANLEHLVAELGLSERVLFLGWVARPELPKLYSSVDLLLATSYASETFGIGPVEAQACGLPVVASRFGGFPEVVDEGRTGLLVPPRDSQALADAVNTLLNDPARLHAMAEAAPVWAAQFAWPAVADRVEAAYRAALDPRTTLQKRV